MYNSVLFDDKKGDVNDNSKHFEYCEKRHIPYISVSTHNHKYDEIFYDITNLDYDVVA